MALTILNNKALALDIIQSVLAEVDDEGIPWSMTVKNEFSERPGEDSSRKEFEATGYRTIVIRIWEKGVVENEDGYELNELKCAVCDRGVPEHPDPKRWFIHMYFDTAEAICRECWDRYCRPVGIRGIPHQRIAKARAHYRQVHGMSQ